MNSDRYDLEQAIMRCWSVCDDLRSGMDRHIVACYYDEKFKHLWNIFEEVIYERNFNNATRKTQVSNKNNNEK